MKSLPLTRIIILSCFVSIASFSSAQKFVHPGINQTSADLELMKKMVLAGQQPYKGAFDRLKAITDTVFQVKPHTHVLRGPYGKPNIGGDDLSKSANMAYSYAVMWYITGNKIYADKAIQILNEWSPVLWHFDYNDAKLLAAWTGHQLCNAAEILRYTKSGWLQQDIDAFTNMLMGVYYPLLRFYYPQANGNWDGAIIHTILSIAIFTDNRKMFNNAIDHFLHAPVNGSIFKYIFPSGQCQETARDQGHVQLGIGEFAGAAQVAYTQGVDLFSIADNRIALGFEFTASYILGDAPFSYMPISERARVLRDDYEYVYRHYTAKGVNVPYTKRAADSVRPKATRSILTSVRAWGQTKSPVTNLKASKIGYIAGAAAAKSTNFPADAIVVSPGQSIQAALDAASGSGRWVILKKGLHTFSGTLNIPSNVTLIGEGIDTKLFLDPASGNREAMVNKDVDLHDVTIRDLVIECNTKTEIPSDPNSNRSYRGGYNRGGIIFRSTKEGQMKNITLTNITVQNGTYNGVFISGAAGVNINGVDLNENGATVPPGAKLNHNLLLTHCSNVTIQDSRLSTSAYGCGVDLEHCNGVTVNNCEIVRNAFYGILVTECKNVTISNNLVEGNDRTGIMIEYLQNGCENISASNNIVHFNNGFGLEAYAVKNMKSDKNRYEGNGKEKLQEKISPEKFIIME